MCADYNQYQNKSRVCKSKGKEQEENMVGRKKWEGVERKRNEEGERV